jgi:hypothetical protein
MLECENTQLTDQTKSIFGSNPQHFWWSDV